MKVTPLFTIFVIGCLPLTALGDVDQEFFPTATVYAANVGLSNLNDFGQTFTVGRSGIFTGFDISVARQTGVTLPLLYDVRKIVSGLPAESDSAPDVLAAGSIPATATVAINFHEGTSAPRTLPMLHIDVGQPFPVTENEVLTIVLRSDDPEVDSWGYLVRFSDVDSSSAFEYPGGQLFVRDTGTWRDVYQGDDDMLFRTYVIPEPTTATLLLLGLLGCGWRRRR